MRNLTPALTSADSDSPQGPRQWKLVGANRAHICTFCGGVSEATVGFPDKDQPILWQIGICSDCVVDSIMTRFSAVKHQGIVQDAHNTAKAANAIAEARRRAGWERYDRQFGGREPNPEVEAEATRKLADEEERIAREHDMCPG
jgi:hypothetical protein